MRMTYRAMRIKSMMNRGCYITIRYTRASRGHYFLNAADVDVKDLGEVNPTAFCVAAESEATNDGPQPLTVQRRFYRHLNGPIGKLL